MIDVLLATYRPNAEMLKAQIDSILAQKGVEVNLIQREDEIGEGACANFSALLKKSRAEYVAFSDQDDVWLSDKLEREMALMRDLEQRYGKDEPLLVFTNMKVTDAELNVLSESHFDWIKVSPRRNLPRQIVFQNTASGNTILINAALRELANPIPAEAFMHDHWLMLVTSAFGHLAYSAKPSVLYRQHGGNVSGSRKVGFGYFWWRFRQGRCSLRTRLYANVHQAEAFVTRFGNRSPRDLAALVGIGGKPWIVRVWILLRHRIFKNGLFRNLGTLLVI